MGLTLLTSNTFSKPCRQLCICERQQQSDLGTGRLRWLGCVLMVGGSSFVWSSVQVHADGAGAVPNKMAQRISDPPLDPPSRFLLRKGWPSAFCASSYANQDDSLGPPSPGSRQLFWLWWQMASNVTDGQPKHFSQWICNALSAGD